MNHWHTFTFSVNGVVVTERQWCTSCYSFNYHVERILKLCDKGSLRVSNAG